MKLIVKVVKGHCTFVWNQNDTFKSVAKYFGKGNTSTFSYTPTHGA